ncbi:MAG: hypothetical protein HZA49_03770 [Planctomycetes bacterium]|nr:hypothetical protein [Planctomycetota bacterium]
MSFYRILFVLVFLPLAILALVGEPLKDSEKPRANKADTTPGSGISENNAKHSKLALGQWVKYQVKRYRKGVTEDTVNTLSETDIKISIIAKETVIENEYLWVEFAINEGKEEQRIVKLMVDKDGNPQAERLILKYGKLPAVELHLRIWEVKTRITREMLFDEMTSELNIIPFTRMLVPEIFDQSSVTYETLPIKIGGKESTLNCTRVLLKQEAAKEPGIFSSPATTGYVWYSDKVPLAGLVKLMVVEDKYRTMILISDYGHANARSLIKETPTKLDFREKEIEPNPDTNK